MLRGVYPPLHLGASFPLSFPSPSPHFRSTSFSLKVGPLIAARGSGGAL